MRDLSHRASDPEEMDDAPAEVYAQALGDLAALNQATLTHGPVIRWLTRATDGWAKGSHLRVLDVACGHGDLLRAMARWGKRRGFFSILTGIDLNPRAIEVARTATADGTGISYSVADVFAAAPDPKPDFIVSSQFAHHLTDEEVVRFLGWLEANSARGWLIADLHRHWFPYYGFRLLARAFGWHRIVRMDGTISIARGFTRKEWEGLLASAGIAAEVRWHVPFRHTVSRLK